MYRVVDKRDTKKTFRLMVDAKNNDSVFVCVNPSAMTRKSEEYGIYGLKIMNYHDFYEKLVNKSLDIDKFCIDELENFVKYISGKSKMTGYTLSIED